MKFGVNEQMAVSKIAEEFAAKYGLDESECFAEALKHFTEQQANLDALNHAMPADYEDGEYEPMKPVDAARQGLDQFLNRKITGLQEIGTGWHMTLGTLERIYVGMPAFNAISPQHSLADEIVLVGDDGQGLPLPAAVRYLGAMMTRRDGMDLGAFDLPSCMVEAVGCTTGDTDRVIFEKVWAELFATASQGLTDALAALQRISDANCGYASEIAQMHSAGPVLH